MSFLPRSVPDVAEQLLHEFGSVCSGSVVSDVVMRLSRNGAMSLALLAELARAELAALAEQVQPVCDCGRAP